MTLVQICEELSAAGVRVHTQNESMLRAFALEMFNRSYRRAELHDAFTWFRAGWNARNFAGN